MVCYTQLKPVPLGIPYYFQPFTIAYLERGYLEFPAIANIARLSVASVFTPYLKMQHFVTYSDITIGDNAAEFRLVCYIIYL